MTDIRNRGGVICFVRARNGSMPPFFIRWSQVVVDVRLLISKIVSSRFIALVSEADQSITSLLQPSIVPTKIVL